MESSSPGKQQGKQLTQKVAEANGVRISNSDGVSPPGGGKHTPRRDSSSQEEQNEDAISCCALITRTNVCRVNLTICDELDASINEFCDFDISSVREFTKVRQQQRSGEMRGCF